MSYFFNVLIPFSIFLFFFADLIRVARSLPTMDCLFKKYHIILEGALSTEHLITFGPDLNPRPKDPPPSLLPPRPRRLAGSHFNVHDSGARQKAAAAFMFVTETATDKQSSVAACARAPVRGRQGSWFESIRARSVLSHQELLSR